MDVMLWFSQNPINDKKIESIASSLDIPMVAGGAQYIMGNLDMDRLVDVVRYGEDDAEMAQLCHNEIKRQIIDEIGIAEIID